MLLQQAIAYISRKRTRNLVLFLILLLILSCLYFCFSLMQVGGKLEDHIKQSAGTSFSLARGLHVRLADGPDMRHPDISP